MSAVARHVRQSFALQHWTHHWLVCLLLGGVLGLSGCGIGNLENSDNTSNTLNGIVALSANDAWAVGWASGQGSSPLIEHWDGRAWSLVPAPSKGDRSVLEGVAARSAQDVWAVGRYYQGSTYETLIEHWNGSAWSIVSSPNGPGSNVLGSVAVVSATDVWAVGTTVPCPLGQGLAAPEPGNAMAREDPAGRAVPCTTPPPPPHHPLIEHWDGSAWSIFPSPSPISDPKADGAGLSSVVAMSAKNVWAVGSSFDRGVTPADGAALIEHWDGTAWSIMTAFDTALGGRTWATAFLSSSDIWGVEYTTSQSGEPTIEHWNGNTWIVVVGPPFDAGSYFVGAMAASGPDDLWAVGNQTPSEQVFTMHWNGSAWSLVPCPTPAGGYISLEASASLSPNDAWVVGQDSPSETIQLTFLEHWNGHAWSLVPNPNPAQPAPAGQ